MRTEVAADALVAMLRLVGLLVIAVGVVLCADWHGAATTLRERRARWGRLVAGPLWFWRAWGAFMAIGGVMLVVHP